MCVVGALEVFLCAWVLGVHKCVCTASVGHFRDDLVMSVRKFLSLVYPQLQAMLAQVCSAVHVVHDTGLQEAVSIGAVRTKYKTAILKLHCQQSRIHSG